MSFSGLLRYGALATKLKSMSGKLLTAAQLEDLKSKQTVTEAVGYLKYDTAYREVLEPVREEEVHRDLLEWLLHISAFEDFVKLQHFMNIADRRFLQTWLVRHEINMLKLIIRRVGTGEAFHGVIYKVPREFQAISRIDFAKMEQAHTVDDVIEALHGIPYQQVLRAAYGQETQNGETAYFDMETQLDIYYYTNLWRQIKRSLQGKNRKKMEQYVGYEADILNLLWIYRSKKYYHMPHDFIYALLIPVHGRLREKEIKRLVEAESPEELIEIAKENKYTDIFSKHDNGLYERTLLQLQLKLMKKMNGGNAYQLTAAFEYLGAKQLELDNIGSIIECIRYRIPKEEMWRYVV